MNIQLSRIRGPRGLWLYTSLYIAFLYIPVLFLPVFSLNDSIFVSFPLKGFTTQWYVQLLASDKMLGALANSLKVAITVAAVSTVLGTLGAKAVTRYRMPGKGPVVGFIMLPLVIPIIIMGSALLVLFNMLGFQLSLFTIGIGHTLLCVPFAMAVMISRLESFDQSLEEASLDLGETGWVTFWRVTFPVILPGIVASFLLTFTVSLDEFVMAFFLAGNDTTLPIYIWSQLRFPSRLPMVLALGTCMLLVSFVIVGFAEWLRRRDTPPSGTKEIPL